jgi:uncharacterized protein YecT (DUF1311 family)
MRLNVAVFGLLVVAPWPLVNQAQAIETQADLTQNECERLKHDTQELETLLTKARGKFADNPKGLALLEASQSAWSKYRDTQLKLNDPDEVFGPGSGGSVVPMCLCATASEMTRQRVREIAAYLQPMNGDVCGIP